MSEPKMPGPKAKDARMACSPSEGAGFIKQQERLRDRCTRLLADHLKTNPDVVWTPENGQASPPSTEEEKAQLELVLDIQFNEETGQPTFPLTKFVDSRERGRRYPYDFDTMGNINPHRVSSGPAPTIWAHGLPFFPVYKGYYILCGRANVDCVGWLLCDKTRDIMQANPIWSIGAVIAPDSAVNLPHTINRQLILHKPHGTEKDPKYRGRIWARDFVADEHHFCAVVPNPDTNEIEICPLWKAWGYNVRCGPMQDGVKPTVMPKEFFARHGIKDIDYSYLDRPYANQMMDEDEESDGKADPYSEIEAKDPAGTSGEAASSSNQPAVTKSESNLGVDMSIDCPAKAPTQDQEQGPAKDVEEATEETSKEIPKEATETATEGVTEDPREQATEKSTKEPETAASDIEEKQPVVSSSIVDTDLDLGMAIKDQTQKSIENADPEHTGTPATPFVETTVQEIAIVQATQVKPMTRQPDIEQTATGAPAESIHITEPPKVEQTVPEQLSNEELGTAATCGLSVAPKIAEASAS
ncbi:uncharacterized protein N7500_004885 [Penicillium coprophilum]|uniref:uncharacterized protein n=1 Tax=Penicillium coprophilum TaxID=36646 RepID=UPI002390BF21|nr:uncharacterized protein N7500_004885 [Penicillium coprophilum]KAJ5163055.1 hypothetical protein N7500_004885 [Penicillium coprophilum]